MEENCQIMNQSAIDWRK